MTHKGLIRKHVRGKCGSFYLVQLLSEKWSAVWWCTLDIEDLFLAIVEENTIWFDNQIGFARPPVFATKKEARDFSKACELKDSLLNAHRAARYKA